jgi:hypothetical protein
VRGAQASGAVFAEQLEHQVRSRGGYALPLPIFFILYFFGPESPHVFISLWCVSKLTPALSERVLGLDCSETARRYVSLSVYLFHLQLFVEAWLVAQRALQLLTILGGPRHPEIASLHMTLSNIAIELRDANGMIQHANDAQKIRVGAYGSDHEIVGDVHSNTAFLYHRIGRNQIAARRDSRRLHSLCSVCTLTCL